MSKKFEWFFCVDKVLIGVTKNFVYHSNLFLGGINQSESGDIGSSVFEVLQFHHVKVLMVLSKFQQILINDLSLLLYVKLFYG